MNIYTLTFQFANNYGAIIQAYALQNYLESMGNNVRIIDYWPRYAMENLHWYDNFRNSLSIKNFILLPFDYYNARGFDRFRRKYLKLTNKCVSKDQIENLRDVDIIIVGSDQVWNKGLIGDLDDIYFLSFRNNALKVSYAASAGQDFFDEETSKELEIKTENLDVISVREEKLKILLQRKEGRRVELVPDPVFLLKKDQFKKISNTNNKKDYVLIYYSDIGGLTEKIARELAEKDGLKIYKIGSRKIKDGIIGTGNTRIEDFLGWIENAKYIVSSSFHCIALAVIYRKIFFAVSAGNRSDRILTMLKCCGLEDRFISCERDYRSLREEEIYMKSEELIEEYSLKGKSFLLSVISTRK